MPRILHTADVHLGARYADLGDGAAVQRERQFAAFTRTVDLALEERVDLVLIAGDLFDSNTQPRRSVERVAAELARLVRAKIRTVIVPGTHDVYDRASVYRAYDLPELAAGLAGQADPGGWVTVLTPERPDVVLEALDTVVFGRVFETKKAPRSPLEGFVVRDDLRGTWRIGLIHGSLAIPGRTDADGVVFTKEEVAASGLDYLALGHWHSTYKGKALQVPFAYSGAPEPVALDQDDAGKVLLVECELVEGRKRVAIDERRVGRTRVQKVDIDAGSIGSQPALLAELAGFADPDLILDVRLVGVRPDQLDLDVAEAETSLAASFMKVRIRDRSVAALTDAHAYPPDTIIGAYVRDLETAIAQLERDGRADDAAELRDALRLGRLLLSGEEVVL